MLSDTLKEVNEQVRYRKYANIFNSTSDIILTKLNSCKWKTHLIFTIIAHICYKRWKNKLRISSIRNLSRIDRYKIVIHIE